MKTSPLALAAFLATAGTTTTNWSYSDAFTPIVSFARPGSVCTATVDVSWSNSAKEDAISMVSFLQQRRRRDDGRFLDMALRAGFLGQDDDDEEDDEEDDEDDEDEYALSSRVSSSTFAGLNLDPYDPNPTIKPRPGRYGFSSEETEVTVPDYELKQSMTSEERKENLDVMRQIKKFDLADLRLRKDHAGWVEANNDLKRRTKADPWYDLNDRMREAYLVDDTDEMEYLGKLIDKLGGPPPGVTIGPRGYAQYTEIFDIGMSASRAASLLEQEMLEENVRRGKAMAAEARKNQEKARRQYEESMRNPGDREEKEAKERRERMMERLMGELEEDRKKREDRAKEMLGKVPDMPDNITSSFDRALREARQDVKKQEAKRRKGELDGTLPTDDDDDDSLVGVGGGSTADKPKSSAARAREAAAAEAAGGRPRLPGDDDVTQGEITIPIQPSSSTTSGPLTVQVSSTYNTEQSDPPMRKHCFQYTIRITNNSDDATIQLLGRRFEIQTVGSSMKDVVKGEGVTGRQPILKPGEVFEYTSTAPLSVRPIGTTIIAARMKGEYMYATLSPGQDTATPEQIDKGGDGSAELGTFHFVFPEEQQVKPFRSPTDEDDDEDEDDDNDDAPAKSSKSSSPSVPATAASPSSTLPGDSDMESGDVLASDQSVSDSSDTVTAGVRVQVTSSYRPERSDPAMDKHCFAYNIRITNESKTNQPIQLVSRRFEIQTIGSPTKDVVQGPGVTGRQPILQPGESFEYTSTAPLSVQPMQDKTPVVARMEGEYSFVVVVTGDAKDEGSSASEPQQAKLGKFHFILPALDAV